MAKLVVIDSDPSTTFAIRSFLGDSHEILRYDRLALAADYVRDQHPAVVFLNLDLATIDTLELLTILSKQRSAPPVVGYTSSTQPQKVVAAVKSGAFDVVGRPLTPDPLRRSFVHAVSTAGRRVTSSPPSMIPEIVGASLATIRIRKAIERYSSCSAPVMVTGESGVGKELVATALHRLSNNAGGPFFAINCAAIPESLFESEMFGTAHGAYTDARAREGAFERANGGTLFLDEIGDLSPLAQVKLLRAVETKRYRRVGDSQTRTANFRLVAATNRNLKQEVAEHRFRHDLYYRLNVACVRVVPLRDRRQDIPILAGHFRKLIALAEQKSVLPEFAPGALERLTEYSWPGNVRELKNVIWRTMLSVDGDRIEAAAVEFDG